MIHMILMYVLAELGYVLICQVKEKRKICIFKHALLKKSENLTRNKKWLSRGTVLIFNLNVHLYGFVLMN